MSISLSHNCDKTPDEIKVFGCTASPHSMYVCAGRAVCAFSPSVLCMLHTKGTKKMCVQMLPGPATDTYVWPARGPKAVIAVAFI